jgi:hypothetical protein
MRFSHSIITIVAATFAAFTATSCIKESSVSNEEREKISLDEWIALHKPELKNNYQENGGYYVEKLDGDINESLPVNGNNLGSEAIMDQTPAGYLPR